MLLLLHGSMLTWCDADLLPHRTTRKGRGRLRVQLLDGLRQSMLHDHFWKQLQGLHKNKSLELEKEVELSHGYNEHSDSEYSVSSATLAYNVSQAWRVKKQG